MSDKLNNQERGFKHILENAEFEPNMEGLWDRVEEQLEEEPRRKQLFLWWGGAGMVVLLIFAIGYPWGDSSYLLEETLNIDLGDQLTTPVSTHEQSNAHDLIHSQKIEAAANENNDTNEKNKTNDEQVKDMSSQNLNNESERTELQSEIIISRQVEENNLISSSSNPYKKATEIDTDIHVSSSIPGLHLNDKSTEILIENDELSAQLPSSTSLEMTEFLVAVEKLPFLTSELTMVRLKDDFEQVLSFNNSREGNYFVTFRGGVVRGFSKVTDVNVGGDFEIEAFEREEDKLGYDIGVDIGRYFGDWRVFGGGNIRELVTRYTQMTSEETVTTENGTAYIYIDELGNSTPVDGAVSVTTQTNYDIQWHRRHQMVDLHIGVGRKLFQYGSFSFGLDAIIGYNVYANHSGYQLVEGSDVFQTLKSTEENNYRNNMGTTAAILGNLAFTIKEMEISLVPVWRKQFNPLTKTENIYQIKNSQLGLQLGITYKPRWK